MSGGSHNEDHSSTPHVLQSLARVRNVKTRLKTKSEAMQAYADWLYDRLAQSTKVGFVLHATSTQKKVLVDEWEASHKRLLMFKESTEEIQFTFRKLQKSLDLLERKLGELEALRTLSKDDVPDADQIIALLADLRDACASAPKLNLETGLLDLSCKTATELPPAGAPANVDMAPRSSDPSHDQRPTVEHLMEVSENCLPDSLTGREDVCLVDDVLSPGAVAEDLTVYRQPCAAQGEDEFDETNEFEMDVEDNSILDASLCEPIDLSR